MAHDPAACLEMIREVESSTAYCFLSEKERSAFTPLLLVLLALDLDIVGSHRAVAFQHVDYLDIDTISNFAHLLFDGCVACCVNRVTINNPVTKEVAFGQAL